MTREEVTNLFVATHGPQSKFDTYTAMPKGLPFPSRVSEGVYKLNKLLETRDQAKARFNKQHKIYFTPTAIGSVMDENIARVRKLAVQQK